MPESTSAWVERFWAAERPGRAVPEGTAELDLAGIGTVAARALASPRLARSFAAAGVQLASTAAPGSPGELFAGPRWRLALVLSPYKGEVAARCDELAPSAGASAVVDTLLRVGGRTVGLNTNTWAAQAALEALVGLEPPRTVLVLGTGSSARSVLMAARRAWPAARLEVLGRRPEAVAELSGFCGAAVSIALEPGDVVVNATTYGETEASEASPPGFDIEALCRPGTAYFDLNNRVGTLPLRALAAGAKVLTGTFMQLATDAIRASLALETRRGA